jgi:hypothetical protein
MIIYKAKKLHPGLLVEKVKGAGDFSPTPFVGG